jgi:hypothetical protein
MPALHRAAGGRAFLFLFVAWPMRERSTARTEARMDSTSSENAHQRALRVGF